MVYSQASLLVSVSLALLCASRAVAFSSPSLRMLPRTIRLGTTTCSPMLMQKGEGRKEPDESWRDKSDDYDGGSLSEGPQPPPYSKPRAEPENYEWLRSGRTGGEGPLSSGLFEDTRGRASDPIRQQEWNAVNRFSNESGFKLAGAGIVLLFMVYTSIYNSGGMDGSRRYAPVTASYEQGCDLESDPDCRY
uniref:Uncharacterized protein n=1 Tax=Hemiselmis andersenii TaxID=464988 RepID=A0A6T8JEJ6_HEMAN|mmetsp:Transcript_14893/g.34359  ORF Transcript_14893/g.34359 Transcript_14893/m.34359 type:complete len:191 (+) Transcript_14893:222-794(+)